MTFCRSLFPEIVRSRDPKVLELLTAVVDVGGVCDLPKVFLLLLCCLDQWTDLFFVSVWPAQLRFDHHQREFSETFSPEYHTRLSSAGLVFKFVVCVSSRLRAALIRFASLCILLPFFFRQGTLVAASSKS